MRVTFKEQIACRLPAMLGAGPFGVKREPFGRQLAQMSNELGRKPLDRPSLRHIRQVVAKSTNFLPTAATFRDSRAKNRATYQSRCVSRRRYRN